MGRIVALALIAVFSLAGCASVDADQSQATPAPAVTATPSPTPTITATATPSPSAVAPEEPPVAAASCETILTDDEYAALAEDGLTPDPNIRAFDSEMQSLMDQGFGCYWTRGGGDVRVWYAQADQDPAAWTALSQQLVDAGWAPSTEPIEGVLAAPADHDPMYTPAVVHVDGVTYYASYADYFTSVKALVG